MESSLYNQTAQTIPLPFFGSRASCGFPSPGDDFLEQTLDLNELVITHPSATFLIRAQGDSMQHAGIFDGDILVVDRSLTPQHQSIVMARLDDTFTIKRLYHKGETIYLVPANPRYRPIPITAETDFEVWGVVSYVIHKAR